MAANVIVKNRVNTSFCKIARLIGESSVVTKDSLYKQLDCWDKLYLAFQAKYKIRIISRARRQNMDQLFVVALAKEGKGKGMLRELEELATEMYGQPKGVVTK